MNLRQSFMSLVLPLAMFGLISCGGGSGNSSAPSRLLTNVKVLPADGSVQISALTSTSVTLSGTVPALQTGDVILNTTGNGFMLKVVSAQTTGSSTVVTTTQASIEDTVQSCNLQVNRTLNVNDLANFTPTIPGATLTANTNAQASNTKAAGKPTFHLSVPSTSISTSAAFTVGVEADLDFGISVKLKVDQATINQFSCVSTISASLGLKVAANSSSTFSGDVMIGTVKGTPFLLGDLPILIFPVYELHAKADGKISASMSWQQQTEANLSEGFSYSSSAGWTPVGNASASISDGEIKNSFNANLNVTPIAPKITLLFDNVVGPEIFATVPTLVLQADVSGQPPMQNFLLTANFSGGGGIASPVFKSLNKEFPSLISKTVFLYKKDGPVEVFNQ